MSMHEYILSTHPDVIDSLFGRMHKHAKHMRQPKDDKARASESWFVHTSMVVKVTNKSEFFGRGSMPSGFGASLVGCQMVHCDEVMCVFKYQNAVAIVARRADTKHISRM